MSTSSYSACFLLLLSLIAPLSALEEAQRIGANISALADDGIPGNAMAAMCELRTVREPARRHLLAALDSDDWQQRQLAGHLLQRWDQAPTASLIRVSIEGLRHDHSVFANDGPNLMLKNADSGLAYLAEHPTHGTRQLRDCLASDDPQQRFLAAVLLGMRGDAAQVRRICAILVPHLKANELSDDARLAMAALDGLGAAAREVLAACDPHAGDEQYQAAMHWLLSDPATRPETVPTVSRLQSIGYWGQAELFWDDFPDHAPEPLDEETLHPHTAIH